MVTVDTAAPVGRPIVIERLIEAAFDLLDAPTVGDAIEASRRLRSLATQAKEVNGPALHAALDRHTASLAEAPERSAADRERLRRLESANAKRSAVAALCRSIRLAGERAFPGESPMDRRCRQMELVVRAVHDFEEAVGSAKVLRLIGLIIHVQDSHARLLLDQSGVPRDARLRDLSERQALALASRLESLVPTIGTQRGYLAASRKELAA